jgi:hypothetical protein
MDKKERYFWDLTGYLVLRGVLSTSEIKQVNSALDYVIDSGMISTEPENRGARESESLRGTGPRWAFDTNFLDLPEPHGQSICNLMIHPEVVLRMNAICGKGWRLDHGPQFNNAVKGTVGLTMHGQGNSGSLTNAYKHFGKKTHCGGVTVTWNLTDSPAGGGGFCCVQGRTNLAIPCLTAS